jgi:RND family efflux transporter MFP subunit
MPSIFRSTVSIALVGLAFLVLPGCGEVNEYKAPPPPEVSVAKPVSEEVADFLEFTGSTRATDMVTIRARVNGYLKSIEFRDGADVKQGDLLFVIEPEPFEAALASAKANQKKAEAAYKLAAAEIKRTEPLVKRGALPEQELDVKEADLATADAGVAAAKAAVTQAELSLAYTQVRAPLSGRIGRHLADVGNLVQAETTVLARIESYTPLYVYFTVGEGDVLRYLDTRAAQLITSAGTDPEPPQVFMGLGNEEGYPHTGTLEFSDLGVDPDTGTQLRRAVFKNEDRRLVPGLFARVRLPISKPKPELLVSERAIGTDQRGEYVLVVDKDNTVEYRPVKLGTTVHGMRVVDQGLKADEWIVVNGLQRARPGAKVDPKREEQTVAEAGQPQGKVPPDEQPVDVNLVGTSSENPEAGNPAAAAEPSLPVAETTPTDANAEAGG